MGKKKGKKAITKVAKKVDKAQWPKWTAPYQPNSNLHLFSQAMLKKGGMTVKEFTKLIKKTGGAPNFILRVLRKGVSKKGWTWDFDDSRDRYRMTNLKDVRKHKK